jgi:hypothetical protein
MEETGEFMSSAEAKHAELGGKQIQCKDKLSRTRQENAQFAQ